MTTSLLATTRHQRTTLLEVTRRRMVADGVLSLTLADPAGHDLPGWVPGAHIDLVLPDLGLTRQYSLCGSPDNRSEWQLGVLRQPEGRGGSRYVHDALPVGARVEVRGPRNNFELLPAQRYLFIAGGIGITPILPMIHAVAAEGRPWELLYGGRTRRSMAFLADLAVHGGGRVRVYPQDETGLLPLASVLGDRSPGLLVYCCGPEPLLAAVEARCAGWPAGLLRTERFAARREPAGQEGFELELRRSERTLRVPPDRSILEVVEAAGVAPLFACREGVCGTCETRVLEGVPDHRDGLLTEEERQAGESLMICVSRARSARLVLDL